MKISALREGGAGPLFSILLALVLVACIGSVHAENEAGYELGPGDLIKIQVHGEEDLTVELRLEGDGYISYPFLGEIKVAGLTVDQLQKRIADGLRGDYLLEPDVRVFVQEYRPVYVNGEVKDPGGYAYVPGLTVQKAVVLAGGFTDLASKSRMYVIREQDPNHERQRVDINTSVQPGDTLIIEEGFF